MTEEPKDRLRSAREALGVSRARLAAQIGRSSSTIRAHETGQNNILPDAAALYAKALGVSPSWILYGQRPDDPPHDAVMSTNFVWVQDTIYTVPLYYPEEVRRGPESREELLITMPGYEGERLIAFKVSDYNPAMELEVNLGPPSPYIIYVICSTDLDNLSLVDEVVVKSRFHPPQHGDGPAKVYCQLDIWRVGAGDEGGSVWEVYYQGESQRLATDIRKFRRGVPHPDFELLGVVVGRLEIKRRGSKALPREGGD